MKRLLGTDARHTGRRRFWVLVAVVALVAVDVVLVAVALQHGHMAESVPEAGETPAVSAPAYTTTPPESAAPGPSSSPTESPTESPSAPAAGSASPRLLVLGDDGLWWRATPGSCAEGGGSLERSTDGGVTWESADVQHVEAATYLQIEASSDGRASVVLATSDCEVQRARTFVSGAEWQDDPAGVGAATYVTDDDSLVIGGEAAEAPCDQALDIAQGTQGTALLCSGGLYEQASGEWRDVSVGSVLDVAPMGDAWIVARGGIEGCDGVSVESLAAGADQTQQLACVSVASPERVTVAATGSTAVVWAGDEVVTATIA